jgi:hypothetical protein
MFNFLRREKVSGLLGPDPVDERDFLMSEILEGAELPLEFFLQPDMPQIQKQNWGTCTAHAVDAVKEFQEGEKLSQRFIYYNTKRESGLWTTQGDYLRNACKAVTKYGAPLEVDFPDSKENSWEEYIQKRPSSEVYKKAEQYKGKSYFRVDDTLEAFRQSVFQNQSPIATGIRWNRAYRPNKEGRLPLPTGKKTLGHAICCVGWTDNKLWFRNSWGKNWGNEGYFNIPFIEFNEHEIWDGWVLKDLTSLDKEGWVAGKYLERIITYEPQDSVKTFVSKLNVRKNPNGKIIRSITPSNKLSIKDHPENGKQVGQYKWYLVSID